MFYRNKQRIWRRRKYFGCLGVWVCGILGPSCAILPHHTRTRQRAAAPLHWSSKWCQDCGYRSPQSGKKQGEQRFRLKPKIFFELLFLLNNIISDDNNVLPFVGQMRMMRMMRMGSVASCRCVNRFELWRTESKTQAKSENWKMSFVQKWVCLFVVWLRVGDRSGLRK